MDWFDPLFFAAAGAGAATIANFALLAVRRLTDQRAKLQVGKVEYEASLAQREMLLEALESARRSNVESAELIQKVEAELGLAKGSGSPTVS